MLIHPWDAARDAAEWRDWLASTDRFGVLAVNNTAPVHAPLMLPTHFTLAGDDLLIHLARPNPVSPHLQAAAEVRMAVIGDYAYIPTGEPNRADATRMECPPATIRRSNLSVVQRLSTIPKARPRCWLRNSVTFAPEGRHALVAAGQDPYGRMLAGIRGVRLAVLRAEAKFKYDDAKPVEFRQRTITQLKDRGRALDAGAAAQQRRRLAAIGDWQDRPEP